VVEKDKEGPFYSLSPKKGKNGGIAEGDLRLIESKLHTFSVKVGGEFRSGGEPSNTSALIVAWFWMRREKSVHPVNASPLFIKFAGVP